MASRRSAGEAAPAARSQEKGRRERKKRRREVGHMFFKSIKNVSMLLADVLNIRYVG
jgi:hypothetical protein